VVRRFAVGSFHCFFWNDGTMKIRYRTGEHRFADAGGIATLRIMDAVRFGRALGFGARQAVKTVTAVVDAATAENPSAKGAGARSNSAASASANRVANTAHSMVGKAAHTAAQTVVQARSTGQGLRRGGKSLRESTWRTFTRLWGVLWLEVVGVLFGIFALFALTAVCKLHPQWRATATNTAEHRQFLVALAMLAIFGYFCVTSYVRAHRRERRR
jgi:hypothetical protein